MHSILTRKSYFNTRRPIKLPDPTIFTVTRSSKSKTQIKKAIIWIILVGYKVHKSNWKFFFAVCPFNLSFSSPSAWQRNKLKDDDNLYQVSNIPPSPPSQAEPKYRPSKEWFEGRISALRWFCFCDFQQTDKKLFSPPQLGLPLQLDDASLPPPRFSKVLTFSFEHKCS